MGAATVAGVHYRGVGPAADLFRGAGGGVADDVQVSLHRVDRLDRVAQALALAERGTAGAEGDDVGTLSPGGAVDLEPGAGRVFEEHQAYGETLQSRHFLDGALHDLAHHVSCFEQRRDVVFRPVFQVEQVTVAGAGGGRKLLRPGHCGCSSSSTPSVPSISSSLTLTTSLRLVGRFLPTQSARSGSSRWPRSTSAAYWMTAGRPMSTSASSAARAVRPV